MALVVPDVVLENYTCKNCHKYLTVAPITDDPITGTICGRCQREIKKSTPLFECDSSLPEHSDEISIPYGIFGHINHLFPCINRFEGCNELSSFGAIADHEKTCVSKTSKCLNCTHFEGTGTQLISHIISNHPGNYLTKAEFCLDIVKTKSFATNLVKTDDFLFIVNIQSDVIRKQVEVQVKQLTTTAIANNKYLLCFLKGRNDEIFVHTSSKKDGKVETFYFHDVKIDYPLEKVKIHCECMHY